MGIALDSRQSTPDGTEFRIQLEKDFIRPAAVPGKGGIEIPLILPNLGPRWSVVAKDLLHDLINQP